MLEFGHVAEIGRYTTTEIERYPTAYPGSGRAVQNDKDTDSYTSL